jgi:hypothetical protein
VTIPRLASGFCEFDNRGSLSEEDDMGGDIWLLIAGLVG